MKAGDRLFWSKGGEEVAVVWLGSGNWVGVWVGGEVKVVDRNELSTMDGDLFLPSAREKEMRKQDELSQPGSCLNKAHDEELIFVLRAKDPAAPQTIRHWATMRFQLGLNFPDDEKILEALSAAEAMEAQGKQLREPGRADTSA